MKKNLTIENLFLLTIFCTPLYLIRFTLFGIPTNTFELLLISTFSLTVIFRKNILKNFTSLPKNFLFTCFLIIIGILFSILFNNNYTVGFGILKSWFILPLLFAFVLYVVLDETVFLEKIYQSLFLSAALTGLIGLIYKLLNIVTYDQRLTAFYLSPNYLAMALVPGLFFGIYFLQKSFLQNQFCRKIFLYFALLLLIIISLYFTYSYGTWLSVVLAFLITNLLLEQNKKYYLRVIFIFFLIIFALLISQINNPKFLDLANFSTRSSLVSRVMIWKASILMLQKNPFWGIGPGNFQNTYLTYQQYFPPYLEWAVPEPHNLFLAFWLQTSLLGFIGFLLLFFYIFKTLWRLLKNKKSSALAAPLFAFFLYTTIHGLIDTPFWKNDLAFLFWICIFLVIFLKNYQQRK